MRNRKYKRSYKLAQKAGKLVEKQSKGLEIEGKVITLAEIALSQIQCLLTKEGKNHFEQTTNEVIKGAKKTLNSLFPTERVVMNERQCSNLKNKILSIHSGEEEDLLFAIELFVISVGDKIKHTIDKNIEKIKDSKKYLAIHVLFENIERYLIHTVDLMGIIRDKLEDKLQSLHLANHKKSIAELADVIVNVDKLLMEVEEHQHISLILQNKE